VEIRHRSFLMEKVKGAFRKLFYPEPKEELKWKQFSVFAPVVDLVHRLPYKIPLLYFYHLLLIIVFGVLKLYTGDSISTAEGLTASKISCQASIMTKGCGFNAQNCEPFSKEFVVKCPSKCAMKRAWTPIFVGKQGVQYTSFVVGDQFYRGDSWICQAALHQGIITDDQGGCVMVEMSPSRGETFPSSTKNGITSFEFNATYPGVVRLRKPASSFACGDMTIPAQVVFGLMLCILPLFGPSKLHLYNAMSLWVFAFWGFLSADVSNAVTDISEMMSAFIPYLAVNYSLYKLFFEDFLPDPSQYPVEMTVLFFGGLWLGLYLDFLFEMLPPLPPMSFDQNMFRNSGGATVLIAVLVFIAVLAIYYLYMQRKQHQLLNIVVSYGSGFPLYFLFRSYFQLVFHLHHYISALLLLPPVMIKNRFSLFLVPVLFGWYAQGVIKWGFDSPFDTVEGARVRNGRTFGTRPIGFTVNDTTIRQGILTWSFPFNNTMNLTDLYSESTGLSSREKPTAYSLFLNDIEVYRGKEARWNFTNSRDLGIAYDTSKSYFARVAPVIGSVVLDYGKILEFNMANGSFIEHPQFRN
jgi:hypothetical protein